MSVAVAAQRGFDWTERTSDWINPILVKETRQALKSRQFLLTFFAMLVISWLISAYSAVSLSSDADHRMVGPRLFTAFHSVLTVAVLWIVPYGAFRSLHIEREASTFEVLTITTLKPRQIILGKLWSAVTQTVLYYSVITPFIAFTYLLKGIDLTTILFACGVTFLGSVWLSMAALTFATVALNPNYQAYINLTVMAGFSTAVVGSIAAVETIARIGLPKDLVALSLGTGALFSIGLGYFFVMLTVAIAQLKSDAENKSTAIRLSVTATFWVAVAWLLAVVWYGPAATHGLVDVAIEIGMLLAIHWGLYGVFSVTESDQLSPRVARKVRNVWRPFRLFLVPFLPGGVRALMWIAAHLAALVVVIEFVNTYAGGRKTESWTVIGAVGCYILFALGLLCAFARWGRAVSHEFPAAHARMIVLSLTAIAAVAPHLLHMSGIMRSLDEPMTVITDPFWTVSFLLHGIPDSMSVFTKLAVVAGVACGANFPALLMSTNRVLHDDR